MESKINVIKADYAELVAQLKCLDAQLVVIAAREVAKKAQLAERKALLAERVRSAYDTDRTSLLESFLSGGTFTDLLAEMSYFIDVGEQDKALANQIAVDQETLAALHQTTEAPASGPTSCARRRPPRSGRSTRACWPSRRPRPSSRSSRSGRPRRWPPRSGRTSGWPGTRPAAAAIIREAAAKQKRAGQEDQRAHPQAGQARQHPVPVQRDDALADGQLHGQRRLRLQLVRVLRAGQWLRPLSQRHRPGRPEQRAVKAAAAGTVVYVGWNWADGPDPAWIVVIAHSSNLQYVVRPHAADPPGRSVGEHVSKGEVIGYQGSTGHATGAHLHWMVELNGNFVNPRLFL